MPLDLRHSQVNVLPAGPDFLRGQILDLIYSSIYERFNAEGIEIPYPKRDLYVKELPTPPAG